MVTDWKDISGGLKQGETVSWGWFGGGRQWVTGSGSVVTEGAKIERGEGVGWGEVGVVPTFSTNADFKHPGAETVSSWHTEAGVGGVVFGTHKDITRGCEAVRLDAFHVHILHVGQMNGPEERQ